MTIQFGYNCAVQFRYLIDANQGVEVDCVATSQTISRHSRKRTTIREPIPHIASPTTLLPYFLLIFKGDYAANRRRRRSKRSVARRGVDSSHSLNYTLLLAMAEL